VRFNLRIGLGPFAIFFMFSHRQRLEGICSKVVGEQDKHMHYIFWDLEGYPLEKVVQKLSEVQKEFGLGDIYVLSDHPNSYRALCFSKRPFTEYIHILCHSFPMLDFGFFIWSVRRTNATIRLSDKVGRPKQRLVYVLRGYEKTELPKQVLWCVYETGLEKVGKTIELGLKG
jgi:hypothetical protein